jgi:hypothetical protein
MTSAGTVMTRYISLRCVLWGYRTIVVALHSALLLAVAPAVSADYIAIDLSPRRTIHSKAYGAANGHQVGVGFFLSARPPLLDEHAVLWRGGATAFVDLNPAGFASSRAFNLSENQQVGSGTPAGAHPFFDVHALLWSGSAASAVDLNPHGFRHTEARGVSAGYQVGDGWGPATGGLDHALLWNGSAATVVDLHPPNGFFGSSAFDVWHGHQVGRGLVGAGPLGPPHALLWTGSAESAIDLNPDWITSSEAYGVSDGQQVGIGYRPGTDNPVSALLWSGSADSAIDLNPSGFRESFAIDVSGGRQVGYGWNPATASHNHALVWSGSAESVIDLHAFLPPGLLRSEAYGIDSDGNIVGIAWGPATGFSDHAFLWKPVPAEVPESGTLALVSIGAIGFCVYRALERLGGLGAWRKGTRRRQHGGETCLRT